MTTKPTRSAMRRLTARIRAALDLAWLFVLNVIWGFVEDKR